MTLDRTHDVRTADLQERVRELEAALETRAVVGRAQGIIMERYEMGADEAMSVLRRIADRTGNQVSEIAAHLVDTRRIPR